MSVGWKGSPELTQPLVCVGRDLKNHLVMLRSSFVPTRVLMEVVLSPPLPTTPASKALLGPAMDDLRDPGGTTECSASCTGMARGHQVAEKPSSRVFCESA